MTQMPPPGYNPGYPPQGYQQPLPSKSNPLAIVSLICGIVGCLVITPIIGIITGLLGLKGRSGKGMAIAGIILSVLWLVGFGAFWILGSKVMDLGKAQMVKVVSAEAQNVLNDIHDDGKQAVSLIPLRRVGELHDELQPLGRCTGVTVPANFSIISAAQKGGGSIMLDGTATFEKGASKNITIDAARIDANNGTGTADIKDIIIK